MPGYDSLRRCLLVTVILFIMPSTYMQLLVLTLFHGIGVVIHMRCFPFASLDVGDFENYADAIVLVQGLLNVFVGVFFKIDEDMDIFSETQADIITTLVTVSNTFTFILVVPCAFVLAFSNHLTQTRLGRFMLSSCERQERAEQEKRPEGGYYPGMSSHQKGAGLPFSSSSTSRENSFRDHSSKWAAGAAAGNETMSLHRGGHNSQWASGPRALDMHTPGTTMTSASQPRRTSALIPYINTGGAAADQDHEPTLTEVLEEEGLSNIEVTLYVHTDHD